MITQKQHSAYEFRSRYETVFCIFMLILAFFFRANSAITYPQILYVFTGILSFNFIFNRFLKRPQVPLYLSGGVIFINGILVTLAIHYSGGQTSYLWVMYLLPVFTACLLMGRWGMLLTTLYVIFLNAGLYLEAGKMETSDWLHILSRTGLFILAASITWKLASSEKSIHEAYQQQREKLEQATRKMRLQGSLLTEDTSHPDAGQAIHSMNSALTIILGSVQLMICEGNMKDIALEDMKRIESAARRCVKILKELTHGCKENIHS